MESFASMFGVGLVTSFHCVAMCGALVATYAVRDGSHGAMGLRMVPHLVYQAAKITSYVLVGLILGLAGAAFDLAGVRGWVMVGAGLFMMALGVNMTGRFRALRRLTFRPPAALVRAIGRVRARARLEAEEGRGSLVTPAAFGLLTGLMPCGPLQAAQLTAASAGDALAGAIVMLGFGLGTAPLMIVFGVGSGYLGEVFKRRMQLVAAVIVIMLGLVILNRGAMLVGSPVTFEVLRQSVSSGVGVDTAQRMGADGVVEIDLVIENVEFIPDRIEIPADEPVRLVVDRREDNTCSDQLAIPQLGILVDVAPFATTIVDVPATPQGTYTLTCGMGMMSGRVVVGDTGTAPRAFSPVVALGVLLAGLALYGVFRMIGSRSEGACERDDTMSDARGPTIVLGFTATEVAVMIAALLAAVLTGLLLGGGLT